MRDRETIHEEIDRAQSDLQDSLAELKGAVRYEADPARNVERALHFGGNKLRDVLTRAWAEWLALMHEVRHTAELHGWRAALVEIWYLLRDATRDLVGALRHAAV